MGENCSSAPRGANGRTRGEGTGSSEAAITIALMRELQWRRLRKREMTGDEARSKCSRANIVVVVVVVVVSVVVFVVVVLLGGCCLLPYLR